MIGWRENYRVCFMQYYYLVPDMTYNVFTGTLNPTQSIDLCSIVCNSCTQYNALTYEQT